MANPRKKRRTDTPGNPSAKSLQDAKAANGARIPKSMVIRMGASNVGPSVTQLVHDTRQIMEPHTASRLRERRSNRLRDYTTMAGPLGVSHFLLFSRGKESGNVNLRLGVTPRGPTLGFRVEKYSLCKDVVNHQKRPKGVGGGLEHVAPPLLVMNNFTTPTASANSKVPKHLESLLTSTFQSLFPPISPHTTPLSHIRRVLLLNREASTDEDGSYIINLRHYAITTRILHPNLSRGLKRLDRAEKHGVSRSRKVQPGSEASGPAANGGASGSHGGGLNGISKPKKVAGALPNLGRLDDMAEYLLDGGFTSASESEVDTDAEVEVLEPPARKVLTKREKQRRDASRATGAEEAATAGEANGNGQMNEQKAERERKPRRGPPVQKRAIKMTELGPRMRLRLLKVEEGLCEGKVMWHEFVEKSRAEEQRMEEIWEVRRREKEERKRIQRENLLAKRKATGGEKVGAEKSGEGNEGSDEDEFDEDMDDDEWDDAGDEDIQMGEEEEEAELEVDEREVEAE